MVQKSKAPQKAGLEILTDVGHGVSIGDGVVVFGNSLGAGVVTELPGKVTGLGPEMIEVDAKFVSGNSGSPVIHVKTGKVIGIATFCTLKRLDGFGKDSQFNSIERRFAYRLDNIKSWRSPTWQAFQSEAKLLTKLSTRTTDAWNLAIDIAQNGEIAHWQQHLRKDNYMGVLVEKWQSALAKSASLRSSRFNIYGVRRGHTDGGLIAEKQRLIDGVISSLTSDLSFLKPETFTPYHKKLFDEDKITREVLMKYFRFLGQQMTSDPQFYTR